MDRTISPTDGYFDRVLKCVPIEVTAVYVLLLSAASTAFNDSTLRWWTFALFVVGLVGTPVYAVTVLGIRDVAHLVMTTLAFLVIVMVSGGWFATFSWWSGFYPLLVTVVFGVAVAMLDFRTPLPLPRPRQGRGGPAATPPRTDQAAKPVIAPAPPTPPAPRDHTAEWDRPAWQEPATAPLRTAGDTPEGEKPEGEKAALSEDEEDSALLRVWRGVDPEGPVRP